MLRDLIESESAPAAVGGYSQAVGLRDFASLVFVSGQIPQTRDGLIPAGFVDQCRLAWLNLIGQVEAAGLSAADLVKVTTYLADRSHVEENRRVRVEMLGGNEPALTVVIADLFDERWLLEIEAVAAR